MDRVTVIDMADAKSRLISADGDTLSFVQS
nr:MAG TPA: hypothetical protein [Caudoviricetes sp.]